MAQWKKREKALLIGTIGLALLYLSDRLLFSSLRAKQQSLHQEIAAAELTFRTGLAVRQRKDAILREQKQYASYFLPASPERELTATFLKEAERLAQGSGAVIMDLTPEIQPPSSAAGQRLYRAQLKAEADVEKLLRFFQALQTSRLLVKLDRFSLTPKDEPASVLRLEATISITVP